MQRETLGRNLEAVFEAAENNAYQHNDRLTRLQSLRDSAETNDEIANALELSQGIKDDIPVAYQTRKWFFYGLPFYIDESVLVPRFDTETLVEQVIKYTKSSDTKILDLCTGSGCIAVAIAKNTHAQITASDISVEALEVAKKNAALNNVKIGFIRSDLFDSIEDTFDIIVSNPPYARTDEIGKYDSSTLHEPRMALDGGADGLEFYRAIAESSPRCLNTNGILALEIGHTQAEPVKALLQSGGFCDIEIVKDTTKQDRAVLAKKGRA